MLHLGEHCAMGALYKSLERDGFDAPRCHPNTRVAVINRLIDWMTGKFYDRASLWLYGAAGAGKSAIAHTIAEICEKHGWLLATFFFSKTESERNNVKRFVATIAYQIALAIPTSREYIEAAVDHNPWIFDQSIDTQFSKLIIEPLQRLHSTGFDLCNSSFVIIIDGLDECSGNDIQTGIVRSLADAFRSSPYRIRILIASRPEVYLQSAFNYFSTQLQLSRLALSDEYSPEQDIYRFLEDSFRKIRLEHPQRSSIPPSWPGTDALHDLTRRSSGQFIFASTAVSYTGGDPYELPTRRLDVICQLQPPRGEEDLPYAELNSLYHHVLSGVRDIDRLRQILGVLLTLDPLGHSIKSTQKIDGFFFWQPGEAKACLSQLASIIKCGVDGKISILHASLSDFLLDPSRSHGFYLCQESVLGDIAAIGMCHLRQQVINKDGVSSVILVNLSGPQLIKRMISPDYSFYTEIIPDCLDRSTAGTPALQQELSLLSFQRLYDICKMHNDVILFWFLSSSVFEMLDNQVCSGDLHCTRNSLMNSQALEKQFTHLVADLIAFCFQAFLEGAEPDKYLAVLVYHAQHSQLLHVQPPNPASAFSVRVLEEFEPQIRLLITRIITMHPERHRFSLTIQNYVTIAVYFMQKYPDRHG